MSMGEWLRSDNQRPAKEHTGWHAIAAILLLLFVCMSSSCGEEDFTVGGPLPSRPSVAGTNPSATPDDEEF
jgi:hypothetical protein